MGQFKIGRPAAITRGRRYNRHSLGRDAAGYGLGLAEVAGLADGALGAAEADGAAGPDEAVDCATGFTFALASAAAFCAAALAGSGAVAFDPAEVLSSSRRTAELCVPRCA